MKISVVVIAHNEERYIAECLSSLARQTRPADETIVIVHNSTDKTSSIARGFAVTVVDYTSLPGQIYSVSKGIETATGDMILCMDGDSHAEKNWIEEMAKNLDEKTVLIGSWVKYTGTLVGCLLTYLKNKNIKRGQTPASRIWGPGFGFWARDKDEIIRLAMESAEVRKEMNLQSSMEDYWRALNMERKGNIKYINSTAVIQHTKEVHSMQVIRRFFKNSRDVVLMNEYFKKYR